MSNHTPTIGEWVVDHDAKDLYMIIEENGTQDGIMIAGKIRKDRAKRIVRAVNAHDDLVNALREVTSQLAFAFQGEEKAADAYGVTDAIKAAKAALAKAKKGKWK